MKVKLLSPMQYGKPCEVKLENGKTYTRIVRYSKGEGLYVVVATRKYPESEMETQFSTDSINRNQQA